MKAEQYWRAALGELEIQLSQASYYTWFRNTKPVSYTHLTLPTIYSV